MQAWFVVAAAGTLWGIEGVAALQVRFAGAANYQPMRLVARATGASNFANLLSVWPHIF